MHPVTTEPGTTLQSSSDPLHYEVFTMTMRSNTTFGVDASGLRVFTGQDPIEMASRTAKAYGATLVRLVNAQDADVDLSSIGK
jgi:hypothetical protein